MLTFRSITQEMIISNNVSEWKRTTVGYMLVVEIRDAEDELVHYIF